MSRDLPVFIEGGAAAFADAWLDREGRLIPLRLQHDPREVAAAGKPAAGPSAAAEVERAVTAVHSTVVAVEAVRRCLADAAALATIERQAAQRAVGRAGDRQPARPLGAPDARAVPPAEAIDRLRREFSHGGPS